MADARIAPRHRLAVELLAPRPGDRVLEIGGGNGIATGLVVAELTTGHLTAIDRSAKMAAASARRNAPAVAAGRLAILTGNFEETPLDDRFDRAFAVNVDFPRHPDLGWGPKLRDVVVPKGLVVLVMESPAPATAARFGRAASEVLAAQGFSVEVVSRPEAVAVRAVR